MPRGSDCQGPGDALDRYVAVVERAGGDVKGAKNPYTSHNGHMFSFLDADGAVALRLSDELAAKFIAQCESGPVRQYGAVMRGYVSVPDGLLSDAPSLVQWFEKSWSWTGTLDPKPTKK